MGGGFVRFCQECGAPIDAGEPACWICGGAISLDQTVPASVVSPPNPLKPAPQLPPSPGASSSSPPTQPLSPPCVPVLPMRAPPVAPVGDRNPWQFSIASLLALTTLVAVCLGLAFQAPGLAIALAIASVPALIRTFGISNMWRKAGQPLTFSEQCLSFGGSLLVVTAVAASLVTAFLIVFVPLCGLSRIGMRAPNHGIEKAMEIGAWILGAAAGLSVAGIAFYELWLWWHFRFRKEGKPPTLEERLGRFGYTAVLVLVPLCAGVAAAMASGWMMGMAGRPAHGYATSSARAATYVATVIGFLAAWSLTTWMCVRHFQRIWRVVAVMVAAYFGCSLGAGIAVSWLAIFFPPQSEGVLVVIGAFTGLIVGAWICFYLLRLTRSASAR